ncbi:MAG: GntR family transcriptional regulator [Eubacteriales bacterium]|nr:GntR family transcriptional regulator [Eubacteriales bacterium]
MGEVVKIKKMSAADLVFEQLKQFILDHTWEVGKKIPSEIELSKELGVNRLTTRIALQRLNALGLLDIRVGDGTYVREFDMNAHIAELSDFYVNEELVNKVGEFRSGLMRMCFPLAVERYTEEELENFYKLCQQLRNEWIEFHKQDNAESAKEFFMETIETVANLNRLLCAMAHNELINYAFNLSIEPIKRHMEYNASKRTQDIDDDQINIWVKQWEKIYEALKNKDADECQRLMASIIQD